MQPRVVRPRSRDQVAARHASQAERTNQLAAALQIAAQIAGKLDLDPLLDTIARRIQTVFGYQRASVLLHEDALLIYRAVAGGRGAPLGTRVALESERLPAQAVRRRIPVLSSNPAAERANTAAFPLIGDEQIYGVLEIQRNSSEIWSDAEMEALAALTRQAALAIQNARRYAETQRRARALTLLDQIRSSIAAQPSLPELLRDIVEQLATALGYPQVSLHTLHGEKLLLQHQVGYAALPSSLSWNDGPRGQVARTGQPLLQPAPAPNGQGNQVVVGSSLYVALRAGGVVCGVLCVESAGGRALDTEDQQLLLALADQLDIAIEFSQVYEALEARVNQLALVDDISRTVTASLDQDAALKAIVTHVPRAVPCQRISLAAYDPTQHTFTIRALWLASGETSLGIGTTAEIGETEAGVALRTGRPHYVYDLTESLYTISQKQVQEGLRSIVHVPIKAPEGCLGMLSLSRTTSRSFSAHDLALLGSIAPHIATAFKNAELYTQAQQAYAELAAAQERNVQAEKLRAIGELASGVAHDFNNLLAIIMGHADLIKNPDAPHFARSHRAIVQAAKDGAHTVRRIQEFVRARPERHTTQVDLAELADDVLHMTKPRWRTAMLEKGITIDVRQQLDSVPPILGNASDLREVITNLILNAVDAMPQGGTLSVATGVAVGSAWLEVRDTGLGITPEVRERIFEPFFTTKAQRGTGLGLAVSRSIARRHEGDLTVESTAGVGSCFRMNLPLAEQVANTTPIESAATAAQGRPLRILLVEDDREVRETLAQLLTLDEHTVECAGDGPAALGLFSPSAYDVVISDLGMPGMNGWELIAQLRERDPSLVTVLLSGWGAQIDPTEAEARGVDFVIAKPIDLEGLHSALIAASQPTR
jgi:signal transduction histidine kinase/ActR/RegA family two-component response regulator